MVHVAKINRRQIWTSDACAMIRPRLWQAGAYRLYCPAATGGTGRGIGPSRSWDYCTAD